MTWGAVIQDMIDGKRPGFCPEIEPMVVAFLKDHQVPEHGLRELVLRVQVETVKHYTPEKLKGQNP